MPTPKLFPARLFIATAIFAAVLLAACSSKEKQAAALQTSARDKWQKQGDLDGALADYSKALELTPSNTEMLDERGNVKLDKGDFAGALADFSAAIAVKPQEPSLYFDRALAQWHKDDLAAAVTDLDQTLKLDPNFSQAHDVRGIIKELQGDFAGAVDDYGEFVDSSPNNDLWEKLHRYLLLRRLGRDPGNLAADIAAAKDKWFKTVATYISGQMSEADFQAAIPQGSPDTLSERQCQADFFVGAMRQLNRDLGGALQYYTRSAAAENVAAQEQSFARAEILRMKDALANPGATRS